MGFHSSPTIICHHYCWKRMPLCVMQCGTMGILRSLQRRNDIMRIYIGIQWAEFGSIKVVVLQFSETTLIHICIWYHFSTPRCYSRLNFFSLWKTRTQFSSVVISTVATDLATRDFSTSAAKAVTQVLLKYFGFGARRVDRWFHSSCSWNDDVI